MSEWKHVKAVTQGALSASIWIYVCVCLFVGACSRICLRVSDQERFRETSVVVLSMHPRHMGYFYSSAVADPVVHVFTL